ncbi:hypothetical protein [uncultured Endozoicomonas sp.]|uniref:hypothetical protein n=1 Tax=uncultured Endozoicomonas sp. TaxID=432652 RepID=UPI00262C4F72|nr:hypothetical protein [uncultured Endozoicomonas sp.]
MVQIIKAGDLHMTSFVGEVNQQIVDMKNVRDNGLGGVGLLNQMVVQANDGMQECGACGFSLVP